nr:nitrilase-related carbon-nitrogen hydrolase [Arthrobacter sp. 260]
MRRCNSCCTWAESLATTVSLPTNRICFGFQVHKRPKGIEVSIELAKAFLYEGGIVVRIGVWQATGTVGSSEQNLARLDQTATRAAREGIDVVVTPELFATGYAPAKIHTLDGGEVRRGLAAIAQRHRIAIVGSSVDQADGLRYISASFFDPAGTELSRYRKSHLFGEEEKSVFMPGSEPAEVFQYAGLRLALGICYDIEFPEFARAAAVRGADALLIPTAVPHTGDVDGFPSQQTYNAERISTIMVPCRALENGIYIAYANHTPPDFTGLSCIVGPHGNVLALADQDEELLVAELSRDEVQRARRINTYLPDLGYYVPASAEA